MEYGVHIADVTFYVNANSEIDNIASRTCTTVYLVHRRTDMLPRVLTENLCSLVGDKERYAFSVVWTVDPNNWEIVKTEYFKSIIKSRAAMTYEQASKVLNDPNDNSELAYSIKGLARFAKILQQRRVGEGALVLASNEMKFNVDFETNSINDIRSYKSFDTNSVVEEFMLLANVYVAQKIYDHYPSIAILRRHPLPKEKELGDLKELLNSKGIVLKYNGSKELSDSLDAMSTDKFTDKIIRMLVTRTMNQAVYIYGSEGDFSIYRHYGLALPIYTHFTSPIRRYADILVHRLLAAAIEHEPLPRDINNKQKLKRVCDNMNKQNRVAFFCSRESNDYSSYLFFKDKNLSIEVAIESINKYGVSAISERYGNEAVINFKEDAKIDTANQIIYIGSDEIKLFDKVIVQVVTSFYNYRRSISYNFVEKVKN